MRPHPRLTHSDYYRDRRSVSELCNDFPGDEILVRGLDAMQMHFDNNGRNIDIPVVRVMNAAHYLAAYMFETTCSGDQTEYDVLAYASVGKDRQLAFLAIIVLAAMLKRTDGLRAKSCRNLILEDRSEDFEEGVTLYERFIRTAEERFAEEDFLIDIPSLATQLREKDELIAQQSQQIATLENTITSMEAQQNNQYIIYQAPVYQGCTFNDSHDTVNNYNTKTEDITPGAYSRQTEEVRDHSAEEGLLDIPDSIIFTKKAQKENKIPTIVQALQKSIIGRKDKTRALVQELQSWQNDNYIDPHYNAQVMYDELQKIIPLPFGYDAFKRLYNNTRS